MIASGKIVFKKGTAVSSNKRIPKSVLSDVQSVLVAGNVRRATLEIHQGKVSFSWFFPDALKQRIRNVLYL